MIAKMNLTSSCGVLEDALAEGIGLEALVVSEQEAAAQAKAKEDQAWMDEMEVLRGDIASAGRKLQSALTAINQVEMQLAIIPQITEALTKLEAIANKADHDDDGGGNGAGGGGGGEVRDSLSVHPRSATNVKQKQKPQLQPRKKPGVANTTTPVEAEEAQAGQKQPPQQEGFFGLFGGLTPARTE